MSPTCPPGYTCKFTETGPDPYIGPWYDGPWGIAIAAFALVVLLVVVVTVSYHIHLNRSAKLNSLREHDRRMHELAIEEQRTMQADAAKGNPDMLKLIRSR